MNNREYSKIWESYTVGYPVDTWEEGQEPQMTWDEYFGGLTQILGEAQVNLSPINEAQPGPDINALIQQIQTLLGQVQQAQAAQAGAATATPPAGGPPPAAGPAKPGLMGKIGAGIASGARNLGQGLKQGWQDAGQTPPAADPNAAGDPNAAPEGDVPPVIDPNAAAGTTPPPAGGAAPRVRDHKAEYARKKELAAQRAA